MPARYVVREWTMTDARTGDVLRGWAAYYGDNKLPMFTSPRRDTCVRWANQHNKAIAAREQREQVE